MGRQIDLECLRLESRVIIRQISVMCIPAESRARPCFCNKVIHRVIHRLWTGVGLTSLVINGHPRVLSLTVAVHIHPRKKYTLK